MTFIDEISKILPVEQIYKDLLQPSAQQVGQGLESVAKTARFALAPFEYLGTLHDRYLSFLKKVSAKVDEKDLVEVHPKITGTVFESIRYLEEDSLLFEMFVQLMSRAITKEQASKAHPAFVQIINQLSPDEALILFLLKKKQYDYWEEADFDHDLHIFSNNRILKNDFPINELIYPENYTMYINHLANLQIAGIPEYRKQEPIMSGEQQIGIKIYRRTTFLDFGRLFSECCIPDIYK